MKKFWLYLSFAILSLQAIAQPNEYGGKQPNPQKEEKIKALYVAYITQQLNITSDEAQKFWPVHTQFDNELRGTNMGNADELTRQQNVLNIKKKYQTSFAKILGAERCDVFFKKDAEFRKKMVERLQQMRQKRMQNNDNGGGRFKLQP